MSVRKKDNATKIFMSRKDTFADVVNFCVFKGFASLSDDAHRVINEVTGSDFEIKSGEEVQNMCKGLDTIKQRAFDAGKQEGKSEGRAELLSSFVASLKAQKQTAEQIGQKLVSIFRLSEAEAAEYLK